MKASVLRAIESVSSISSTAAAIVESMRPAAGPTATDMEKLKTQLDLLQHEILKLRLSAVEEDRVMTDEERRSVETQFLDYIKTVDKSQLNTKFNRSFFASQSTTMRYVLANALHNYMVSLRQPVSPLLLDLIASNGAL